MLMRTGVGVPDSVPTDCNRGEMAMLKASIMLRALLVPVLLLATSAHAQAPKVDRAAEKAIIEQTFRDYAAMFLMGDIKKVTAYYNEPLMLLPTGRAATRAEV